MVTLLILVPFATVFWHQLADLTTPGALEINLILLVLILPVALLTAGYFILTNMLLKKKLNLE
ncbi:MAG: hypothetical protein AB1767_11515 [Bacillota bacterium]